MKKLSVRQRTDTRERIKMTLQECYQELGGDFVAVSQRLSSSRLIEKFIGKFLEDGSFDALCEAMARGERAEAFRAAHTLKGVCANMAFSRLMESASRLTEALRPETDAIAPQAEALLEDVRRDYDATVAPIRSYLNRTQEL